MCAELLMTIILGMPRFENLVMLSCDTKTGMRCIGGKRQALLVQSSTTVRTGNLRPLVN